MSGRDDHGDDFLRKKIHAIDDTAGLDLMLRMDIFGIQDFLFLLFFLRGDQASDLFFGAGVFRRTRSRTGDQWNRRDMYREACIGCWVFSVQWTRC